MERIKTKLITEAGIPLVIEPAKPMTISELYTLLVEQSSHKTSSIFSETT